MARWAYQVAVITIRACESNADFSGRFAQGLGKFVNGISQMVHQNCVAMIRSDICKRPLFLRAGAGGFILPHVSQGCWVGFVLDKLSENLQGRPGGRLSRNMVERLALQSSGVQPSLSVTSTPDYTYPYLSNPGSVFRIGAATKDGTVPDFVKSGRDISFLFPGREVALNDGDGIDKFEGVKSHTGSSVATALAAGLAAIIM